MNCCNFVFKTIGYTMAASTVTIGTTYLGLKLSDTLFGTSYGNNIEKLTDAILDREHLKTTSSSKNVSDILYNSTSIYYSENDKNQVKKNIHAVYSILKNIENDPAMKYFAYVNALNAKANEGAFFGFKVPQLNYLPTDHFTFSTIKMFYQDDKVVGLSCLGIVAVGYENSFQNAVKSFGPSAEEMTTVHEMVHSAYDIVYQNDKNPFAKDDSELKKEYQGILKNFNETMKLKSSSVYCQNEKLKYTPVLNPSPEVSSVEAIAHYAHNSYKNANNYCVDETFHGFRDFIQKHTIPDFIKFIEHHPHCSDITYSDETIHCKILGDAAITPEL